MSEQLNENFNEINAVAPTYAANGAAGARSLVALLLPLLATIILWSTQALAVPIIRLNNTNDIDIKIVNKTTTTFVRPILTELPATAKTRTTSDANGAQLYTNLWQSSAIDKNKNNNKQLTWYKIIETNDTKAKSVGNDGNGSTPIKNDNNIKRDNNTSSRKSKAINNNYNRYSVNNDKAFANIFNSAGIASGSGKFENSQKGAAITFSVNSANLTKNCHSSGSRNIRNVRQSVNSKGTINNNNNITKNDNDNDNVNVATVLSDISAFKNFRNIITDTNSNSNPHSQLNVNSNAVASVPLTTTTTTTTKSTITTTSTTTAASVWHKPRHTINQEQQTLLQTTTTATASFLPQTTITTLAAAATPPPPHSAKTATSNTATPAGATESLVGAGATSYIRDTHYSTRAPLVATTTATTTHIKSIPKTTTARIDYILITDYDQLQERTFWQKYGRILSIAVGISLCVACVSVLIVAVHCYRAATLTRRRATGALALPIPLLPEDQNLLHTEPEHPVPMLSVQTAGCAGMERLGVPTRTSLNTPPDDRGQFSCRMRVDALQARELLAVRGETVIRSNTNSSNISGNNQHHKQHSHHHHHQHHHQLQHQHQHQQQQHYQRMTTPNNSGSGSGAIPTQCNNSITNSSGSNNTPTMTNNSGNNIARGGIDATTLKYGTTDSGSGGSSTGSSCGSTGSSVNSHSHDHHQHYQHQLQQQQTLRCPHHVPLLDSEWGQDRNLQIRTGYQQSEITRSYIKPPPNKTVKDVPEQSSYNFYTLTSLTSSSASLTQQHYATHCSAGTAVCSSANPSQQQQQQHKSKPNVITKLFSRKSSPKSPTALSASSTCSSLASTASMSSMPSTSSSASSLASGTSSVSSSSSASSLSSAPISSLPISTASALKTTACNYGPNLAQTTVLPLGGTNIYAGLAPTTQLLTTIGVSSTATTAPTPQLERIPTPPLSVSVPIAYHQHHYHQYQQQQQLQHQQQQKQLQQQQQQLQQQQLLLDSIVAETAKPTAALPMLKSSSCNLATSSTLEPITSNVAAVDAINVAKPLQATTARVVSNTEANNTDSGTNNCSCNCNNKNCNDCAPTT